MQQAIDAASGETTIVVQPGVYAESLRVIGKASVIIESARLSRRGVTITGAGEPAAIHVRDSALHLSGIAIRTDGVLLGILAEESHVNLQECVVVGNRGGLRCVRSRVHLQKSAILANVIDGGVSLESCDAQIAGCTIQGNTGGGAFLRDVKLRMWRSRVTDNWGGGVRIVDPRQCDFGGSVITGNDGGGITIANGAARVAIHRNTFVRQNYPTDVEGATSLPPDATAG